MRPIGIKLISVIGLLVTLSIFIGCSGEDLLNEGATRYHGTASPEDNGSLTSNIDIVQDICSITTDEETGEQTVEFEPFTAFNMQLLIESNTTAAEFTVESYRVNFRSNHGADRGAQVTRDQMPSLLGTTLNPINGRISALVRPGTSVTTELKIWTVGDKGVYNSAVLSSGFQFVTGTYFVYDVQVVLTCRTLEDDTFTITTPWTPVDFGNYDNC